MILKVNRSIPTWVMVALVAAWSCAGLLFLCGASWARPPRIGVFTPGLTYAPVFEGLKEGLDKLGYKTNTGVSFVIDDTNGSITDLATRAKSLVEAAPEMIFAVSSSHAIAVKQATATIPVVYGWVGDPLRSDLIASYASSKNNLTGVTSYAGPLSGKRLEILKEMAPGVKRVLALVAPAEVIAQLSFQVVDETARKLRVQLIRKDVASKEEVAKILDQTPRGAVDAIYYVPSTLLGTHVDLLIKKAKADRIPLAVDEETMVKQGALFTYGADFRLVGIQAARLANKVLKGEKPADVPSEIPNKLLLVLNATTARQIGLKIPRKVSEKVERVVE